MKNLTTAALSIAIACLLASCGGYLLEAPPGTESIEVSGLASSAADTTATVTWATNVPTTHLVEYGTAPGSYTDSTFQSGTPENAHSVALSGLAEATAYYYRVRNYHASLEDYLSAEQTFTTTAASPPTAAQRLRGIWIIGGLTGGTVATVSGQVDLYDPLTNTWYANVTTLPTPVSFAGTTSHGGNIYVAGGFNSAGTALATMQIYDVAGDSWSAGAAMPAARANADAAAASGRVYVLGGTAGAATAAWSGSVTTYEYTPGSTWNARTNFSVANLTNRFALGFDDVVYNMGGRSAAATLVTTHDGFAATTNGLTQGTEVVLTAARVGMGGAVYAPQGGAARAVVVGGFSAITAATGNFAFQGATGGTAVNLFQYLYYPFTAPAAWQPAVQVDPYPVPVGFCAAAISGDTFYVFGGTPNAASPSGLIIAYRYDLTGLVTGAADWQACASMPAGRYGHGAVAVQQ